MTPAALLLFPGASASRDNRTLVAAERGLAPIPVHRTDFPGRAAGRGGVEKAETAVAHVAACVERVAAELGVPTTDVAVGGRSFGGRMASMAVAEGLEVGALVLLSYPLHPPGKPDVLRTAHLPRLRVPTLLVQGARDPFGTPEELAAAFAVVPGEVTTVIVAGNHSPADGPVVAAVRDWFTAPREEAP